MPLFTYSKKILKNAWNSFSSIIYPQICITCQEPFEEKGLLCINCRANLNSIDPKERCTSCFSLKHLHHTDACKNSSYFVALASVFDYEGPASSLIKKLKYAGHFTLASSLGNFMTIQFLKLNWPLPDLIVPVPQSLNRYLENGYNHSFLLAQALGKTLEIPCAEILRKKSSALPQAALKLSMRKEASSQSIQLKKNHQNIEDKIILLIDDVVTTGTTLNSAAIALLEGSPKALYALTLCKTNLVS